MPHLDEDRLRAATDEVLTRWPSAGVAVAVVRAGRPAWSLVRGVADASTRAPVVEDTVFRIGSLTKLVTAVAVMQLWEEGPIDLDAPANDYLSAFRITPSRPGLRPATVRHLLTHTSGVGYWRRLSDLLRPGPGSGVEAERLLPLAEYYRRGLPQEVEPGTKWAYSNHGFAALGQIVSDLTGQPLGTVFRERVLEPLGMGDTALQPTSRMRARLATGSVLRRHGLVAVAPRVVPTPGSGGLYSTVQDLARFLDFLIRPEGSGVLQRPTVETMFAPQFRPDPRVPGMGLGFERGLDHGVATVIKSGIVRGFLSQLTVAPAEETGLVVLTNTGALSGRGAATPLGSALLGAALGVADPAGDAEAAPRPETWSALCGWYAPEPGPVTNLFVRALFGAGLQVLVEDGALWCKPLTPLPAMRRGMRLRAGDPDDPYVFRADLSGMGMGAMPVVFTEGQGGSGRPSLVMDLMTFHQKPDLRNPRRLAATATTAAMAAGLGGLALGRARRSLAGQAAGGGPDVAQ